ncbi:JAB domain-containing protein [Paenibacillus spongiae]|uniref:JAB domain-containing protein n=1 Tax=Paenibacillus spongiae TaxID=2909671 RepID=UPI00283A9B64|nr:JAB domain-containing protein [Paenibacillus spongiae]
MLFLSEILTPQSCILEKFSKQQSLNNAASIVCFYNHRSGNTTACQEDISITRRLVEVGELMGIEVLDHIIIGESQFVSLKEQGVAF